MRVDTSHRSLLRTMELTVFVDSRGRYPGQHHLRSGGTMQYSQLRVTHPGHCGPTLKGKLVCSILALHPCPVAPDSAPVFARGCSALRVTAARLRQSLPVFNPHTRALPSTDFTSARYTCSFLSAPLGEIAGNHSMSLVYKRHASVQDLTHRDFLLPII